MFNYISDGLKVFKLYKTIKNSHYFKVSEVKLYTTTIFHKLIESKCNLFNFD